MTTKKRVLPVRVAMYIGKDNLQVYEDLKEVVKVTGLSMSDVTYFAFVKGFYETREVLLKLDNHPEPKRIKKSKLN